MKIYIYEYHSFGGYMAINAGHGICIAHSVNEAVGIAIAESREKYPDNIDHTANAMEVPTSKIKAWVAMCEEGEAAK